jgi:hypothetical protein
MILVSAFMMCKMKAERIFRRCMMDAMRRKCMGKWVQSSWFLLHVCIPAHLSLVVKKYLTTHSVTAVEHMSYFPGFLLAYFFVSMTKEHSERMIHEH